MPWIAEEMCTGCGICVDECYAGAISLQSGIAVIDEDSRTRCGVCHDVCVEEAIRHDGELVAGEVEENLAWARKLLAHEYYLGNDRRRERSSNVWNCTSPRNGKLSNRQWSALGISWTRGCGTREPASRLSSEKGWSACLS